MSQSNDRHDARERVHTAILEGFANGLITWKSVFEIVETVMLEHIEVLRDADDSGEPLTPGGEAAADKLAEIQLKVLDLEKEATANSL